MLGPEETKKLYPLMNVDDIYGTLYSPGDGTIDPNGLCQALTRSATRAGSKVGPFFKALKNRCTLILLEANHS